MARKRRTRKSERERKLPDIDNLQVMNELVRLLEPLSKEDRQRVVLASFAFLGDSVPLGTNEVDVPVKPDAGTAGASARADNWIRQNSLSEDQLQQVFHLADGVAVIIASEMPGKNGAEKTLNAYILSGLANLLSTGEAAFDDRSARALCETTGCYNSANHAAYLKKKGNSFTGSKGTGWSLTGPGLKRGAELVKELAK